MKRVHNGVWLSLIILMTSTFFEQMDERVFFTGTTCLILLILITEEKDTLVGKILAYLRERLSDSDQAGSDHSQAIVQETKDQAPPTAG